MSMHGDDTTVHDRVRTVHGRATTCQWPDRKAAPHGCGAASSLGSGRQWLTDAHPSNAPNSKSPMNRSGASSYRVYQPDP